MSAQILPFRRRDDIETGLRALLAPWNISERQIRAAVRYAHNVRKDTPGLTDAQCIKRAFWRAAPREARDSELWMKKPTPDGGNAV